jgi:hypothetical protein
MMRKITIAPIIGCVLSAAALASAASAAAVPSSTSAPDIVKMLQDQGYTVQFNGTVPGPLSNCSVDGVHGLTIMMTPDGNLMMKMDSANHGTVFVDVSCTTNN